MKNVLEVRVEIYTVVLMKTHYVQKAARSRLTGEPPQPVREVQCHENKISVGGVTTIVRAWYVKTEDGQLHGQFHSEHAADWFASTHEINNEENSIK